MNGANAERFRRPKTEQLKTSKAAAANRHVPTFIFVFIHFSFIFHFHLEAGFKIFSDDSNENDTKTLTWTENILSVFKAKKKTSFRSVPLYRFRRRKQLTFFFSLFPNAIYFIIILTLCYPSE